MRYDHFQNRLLSKLEKKYFQNIPIMFTNFFSAVVRFFGTGQYQTMPFSNRLFKSKPPLPETDELCDGKQVASTGNPSSFV